jgi:hypothetical protein
MQIRGRFPNAVPKRIEKGSNLARKVRRNTESSIQF